MQERTTPEIRTLTERDAESVWNLRLQALERDPESFVESAEEHRAMGIDAMVQRLAGADEEQSVVGAFLDGTLAGVAGFYRERLTKSRHTVHVWGVYVSAEARGRGLGRALMRALIEKIRSLPGVEQVTLGVSSHCAAARSLYASLGFEPYGIEPRALKVGERYFDVEHMMLRLT